jgi:hypothetical protein
LDTVVGADLDLSQISKRFRHHGEPLIDANFEVSLGLTSVAMAYRPIGTVTHSKVGANSPCLVVLGILVWTDFCGGVHIGSFAKFRAKPECANYPN